MRSPLSRSGRCVEPRSSPTNTAVCLYSIIRTKTGTREASPGLSSSMS
uniref:Uncharacterized protein n=1 Tax=Arundo donax TaxID=35708 RepID=A0A0A9EGP1_ARUDO